MEIDRPREQLLDELIRMKRRIAELERVLEISQELISDLALVPLLKKVLLTAAALTNSDAASILLPADRAAELRFLTSIGGGAGRLVASDIPVPVASSIAGTILAQRKPVIVADAQNDLRVYKEVDLQTGYTTRTLLGMPLQLGDRCIGVLSVLNKRDRAFFSQDDVDLLMPLAAQATIAIENARMYRQVLDHAERLEERVQTRTSELSARNEELEAFDHTVAHDLKNPLSLVVGYAQVMEEDIGTVSDAELRGYTRSIVRNSLKMGDIIDALLLLSGVRAQEPEITALDMARIVDSVQGRQAYLIKDRGAEIIPPKNFPSALGYGPWVEEVWANYVSNAIKYGGTPPRVELGATKQADGMTRFWVHDNGAGLKAEDRKRLFRRFERLEYAHIRGHGLGLSIVQRIIERLGGEVGVESAGVPGQGCTFYFTLPGVPL